MDALHRPITAGRESCDLCMCNQNVALSERQLLRICHVNRLPLVQNPASERRLLWSAMSLGRPDIRVNTYAVHLAVGNHATVRLEGIVDSSAAADLSRLMDSLEVLAYMAVHVDLSAVTALDQLGVQPLIDASRSRQLRQLPPVIVGECSPEARQFLESAGLGRTFDYVPQP
jgi:anti-anti-sigma regulatory factor